MSEQALAQKVEVMLRMQDEMNARVDSDWIDRRREWYRAVWIECAELMDHYGGWKWWKHSEPDYDQVLLEIVDIWHFGLSMRIDAARDYAAAARDIAREWIAGVPAHGFLDDVEQLACAALADGAFRVGVIPALLEDIGRDFLDLYRSYVGKNVLNFFRQDHGYRQGSYRKRWHGREDNEHLSEIIAALDPDAAGFKDAIYAALARRYSESNSNEGARSS